MDQDDGKAVLTYGDSLGCLAVLAFLLISLGVVLLGSLLGDCLPDEACRKDVGGPLLTSGLVLVPAALLLGFFWRRLVNAVMPDVVRDIGFGAAAVAALVLSIAFGVAAGWLAVGFYAAVVLGI